VLKAIADDVLAQGIGVVIDSPCFYDELLAAGQALAAKHGVAYRYIECVTEDIGLLDTRLRSRPALRSQRLSVDEPPIDLAADRERTGSDLFADGIANMKRPDTYLRLDTTQPLDECVDPDGPGVGVDAHGRWSGERMAVVLDPFHRGLERYA
jgi:hypothetical protein